MSAAAVAAMACPALAQDRPAAQTAGAAISPIEPESGYRKAEDSNGFRLIEHGIWEASSTGALGAVVPDASRRAELPDRRMERGGNIDFDFRRAAYLPHVYAAEARYALPVGLLDALVWTESRYNPLAVSTAGAAGLGQLMPGTARELGVINRFDPLENLSGAAKYLRQMLDRFGVVHLALAAYNAGPGAVERARGVPRNGETPAYVRNVLRRWRL